MPVDKVNRGFKNFRRFSVLFEALQPLNSAYTHINTVSYTFQWTGVPIGCLEVLNRQLFIYPVCKCALLALYRTKQALRVGPHIDTLYSDSYRGHSTSLLSKYGHNRASKHQSLQTDSANRLLFPQLYAFPAVV